MSSGRVANVYIHCLDPCGALSGCKLPPFESDKGNRTLLSDDGRYEEGKEQNANDVEEGSHQWM